MLHYRVGDATDPKPLAGEPMVIVHCCNDQGAWGAGFSGALGRRYPVAETAYRCWFAKEGFESVPGPEFALHPVPGFPWRIHAPALGATQLVEARPGLWVCNMVAQLGYRRATHLGQSWKPPYVRYWAIRKGLRRLRAWTMTWDWTPPSVHCPRLGCGLAGGLWEEVEPILQKELVDHGIDVVVYDLKGDG